MRVEQAFSYPVSIFIAGDYGEAVKVCSEYCDEVGLCVTVTETAYVYTLGAEAGVIVGLINYPRFPTDPHEIIDKASELADRLREGLGQESYSIQTPERTIWRSWRAADTAQGTRQGGDVEQAPREAREPGPKDAPKSQPGIQARLNEMFLPVNRPDELGAWENEIRELVALAMRSQQSGNSHE